MKKIIIVDDEVLVKVGIKSLLKWEDYGYTIVADASDGKEAVMKIEEYKPHIVMTDLMMEPKDGFWLMEECTRRRLPVKFIVLSNYNDFENVRRAMKAGASDYVFKLTVKREEMLKALKETETGQETEAVWKNNESEQIVQRNLDVIKKKLFQKLLVSSNTLESKGVTEEINNIPLSVDFSKKYCTLYLKIDNFFIYRKKGDFNNKELLTFTLENIIGEILETLCPCEIFICKECDLVAVLSFKGEYTHFLEELKAAFDRIVRYIRKYYGFGISGAVSQEVMGIHKFHNAVEQNLECMDQRYFYHTGMLHVYEDKIIEKSFIYKNGDMAGDVSKDYHVLIYEVTNELEALEASGAVDAKRMKFILRGLYKKLNLCLMNLTIDIEYIVNKDGVNLEEAVNRYDFFSDVKNTFSELIKQVENKYAISELKPCRREIAEVKSYVNNHLTKDLTVPDMAALANMSESRFSHVFKEEAGVSFLEYVLKIKMDRAEKLLRTTDLKVNEIAEQVGIYNSNYFSAQFKRRKGVSPNQYRKADRAAEYDRNSADNYIL